MSNFAQRNFSRGEVAPALYGRTDQAAYAAGAKTVRNFICRKQGGLDNRPGTELVGLGPGGGHGSVMRLIRFQFSTSQSYVLEFSNVLLRFVKQGSYLGYTIASPYAATDLAGLKVSQTADVMTITHPSYPVYELKRLAETNWTLTPVVFTPSIAAPTGIALSPGAGAGVFRTWVVTAIGASGEESYPSTSIGITSISIPQQQTVSWNAVAGAVGYNLYVANYSSAAGGIGSYGFIATVMVTSFYDAGITPDLANQPPAVRTLFAAAGDYPAAVGTHQSRRLFAGSNNAPETVWTSRSADTRNFTVSVPTEDDDAVTFTLIANEVQQVVHIVEGPLALLLFTGSGEWVINGDRSGILRPTDVNPLNFSDHGSSQLAPIRIDLRMLFVEARATIVRDLSRDYFYGYKGTDMTVMSGHLFEGFTLVDWAYAQVPNSTIWIVRSDGVLLGLTDVAEQEIHAWHRHDTLGTIENVCVVPEGNEDRVYLVVNRSGVRMVERMASRFFTNIQDAIFTDATLTYDGRNATTANTMTLSGGVTWKYDELLTLAANFNEFTAAMVGDTFVLTGSDGTVIRLAVTKYTSPTIVQGFPQMTVPATMQSAATSTWSRAVAKVAGLGHLEGRKVSVFADGYVVANPNNPTIALVVTVTNGVATFDQPYSYLHVGLPYVSDLQTLDLDTPQGASLREKKIIINRLSMLVRASRGVWSGENAPASDSDTTGLAETKMRTLEPYNVPVSLKTGIMDTNLLSDWEGNGQVFVRQIDPLPLSILALIPAGYIPPATS